MLQWHANGHSNAALKGNTSVASADKLLHEATVPEEIPLQV